MIDRRRFMLTALAAALLPRAVTAATRANTSLPWPEYLAEMKQLASAHANRTLAQEQMAARGIQLMRQLDTADPAFQAAIHDAYESGNRFWLWQRLTRESSINGGILNIEQGHDVPLHDHPGATGMVRVLTGEVEVWQFDASATTAGQAMLERVSHRVLRPGDIAMLSPGNGNIHALRARSTTCRMLDYFIPPYVRSDRNWFQPVDKDWTDHQRIRCRRIPETDFYMS